MQDEQRNIKEEVEQRQKQQDHEYARLKKEEMAKGRKEQHPSNVTTEPKRVPKPPPKNVKEMSPEVEAELESIVGHTTASNNWVISGEHTESGLPMLSTDPHLGATIPAFWQLHEITWNQRYASGASLVGLPGIAMGRSEFMSWGLTAAIADNTDMWEEKLNEDETKYFVDGAWRDLEIINEVIKIKGQEDFDLRIMKTHRGPIMDTAELRFNAALLFGGSVPTLEYPEAKYSFGWGGSALGDDSMEFIMNMHESDSIPEFKDKMEKMSEDGYRGVAVNLEMADTKGNIFYQMLVPMFKRKDETPYLGCRILNGQTSKFDWTDTLIPITELPRSLNPAKGFISNANNR